MLHRADGFLLDRVFQPLADWLAGWWSPYRIVQAVAPGVAVVGAIGAIVRDQPMWGSSLEVISCIWMGWWVVQAAEKADRATKSMMVNPCRYTMFICRLIWVAFAFLSFLPPHRWFDDTSVVMEAFCLYLVSVERPTPPPKRHRAPGMAQFGHAGA